MLYANAVKALYKAEKLAKPAQSSQNIREQLQKKRHQSARVTSNR